MHRGHRPSRSYWMADARTGAASVQSAPARCDNGRGVAGDIYAGNAGAEVLVGRRRHGLRSATTGANARPQARLDRTSWSGGTPTRCASCSTSTRIDKYGTGSDTRLLTAAARVEQRHQVHAGAERRPLRRLARGSHLAHHRQHARCASTRRPNVDDHADLHADARPACTASRIAWQNTAYNQPPHPSFFIGNGMSTPPQPNIFVR